MEFFCNTRDRNPFINQYFLVYGFTCLGCGANSVGKTERTLYERCIEDALSDQRIILDQ